MSLRFGFGFGVNKWGSAAAPDGTPSSLALTVISDTEIQLDWTAGSTNHDGHSIERSTNGTTYAEIATVTGATVHYHNTSLTENHYWYRVRAYKGAKYSSYSSAVSNTVPLCVYKTTDTYAWYDYADSSTITKDGSNLVSAWNNKLGTGHNFVQGTETNRPTWESDGILFDGSDNQMTTSGTLIQPISVWMLVKQPTWIYNKVFMGNNATYVALTRNSTPEIQTYSGKFSSVNSNLTVDSFKILKVILNGVNSKLQINSTTATTGDFGTENLSNYSLGSHGSTSLCSNIKVKELIVRSVADSGTNESDIYNYLKSKYSL